jgi:uncharacterized membrane protein YkgB
VRQRTDGRSRSGHHGHHWRLRAEETAMGLGTILMIVLVLLLIGVIPSWPHSRNWGYGPSGGIGLVLVVLVVLMLMGRI